MHNSEHAAVIIFCIQTVYWFRRLSILSYIDKFQAQQYKQDLWEFIRNNWILVEVNQLVCVYTGSNEYSVWTISWKDVISWIDELSKKNSTVK
jgi:hypothetical protein